MTYDIAMPELAINSEKPSKALTALAFNEAFRPKDYQRLVVASKKASSTELKEFLTQEVDHEPKEKVINYLSFPMVAMMTRHLSPWNAADILLIEPNLIKGCPSDIRSKTLNELVSENTYMLLKRKASKELQENLKIGDKIPAGWGISANGTNKKSEFGAAQLDKRTAQAVAHCVDVKNARKKAKLTGTGAKIQKWLQNRVNA